MFTYATKTGVDSAVWDLLDVGYAPAYHPTTGYIIWSPLVYHTSFDIYGPPTSNVVVAHLAPRPPLSFDPYDERYGHVGSYYFLQRSYGCIRPRDKETLCRSQ